jgi:hypothetical protein
MPQRRQLCSDDAQAAALARLWQSAGAGGSVWQVYKHGRYTAMAVADRKKIAALLRAMHELAKEVQE